LELLCLVNPSGELSIADIIDRLYERERDLSEGSPEDVSEIVELENERGFVASRRSEIIDVWQAKVQEWFNVASQRQKLYKESYPFEVTEDEITKLKLDDSKKLYVYLLYCSNLYLFTKSDQNLLANSFEVLCFNALKSLLPDRGIIHLFGSNPLNNKGRYGGQATLWDKINNLSEDLNEFANKF
jgi:ABC-type uncharacterized transport system permease subunit